MDINSLNGTYTAEQISRLTWPIAWSGAPDVDFEAAREDLVNAAREALADNPDAVAVEIRGGEVVATVSSAEVL